MGGVVKFLAGAAVLAFGVALAISGNPAGFALAKAGFYLANLGILEEVSKLFTPRVKRPALRTDVEYSGTIEQRRIIYGTMKASGLNCLRPFVTGADGEFLHQVLAIAGHRVEAMTDVYFNQTTIASANITAITGSATDGKVTAGDFADKAWIRRRIGTQSQAVDWILNQAAPTLWPSTARGREVAYLALQFELDEEVYASGKPDVAVKVQGKRCYDPRLDSSPGANPTNATYIAWTANPALCLADYLTDVKLGCRIAPAKIDWPLVVAAANICDETVSIPGSTTQPRYTCNVILLAATNAQERNDNIALLRGAMMGVCYRQGGLWRMYAGAAQTPSFALTEADIVGSFTLRRDMPVREKYNFVRGQYVDAARDYQLVDFQPQGSATYETADGARLPREVEFAACTNEYEAQRNAIILRKQSRLGQVATAQFGLSGFKVLPFSVGTLTVAEWGWSAKPVQCIGWNFNPTGSVELTLREDDATVWNDPATGDYVVPGAGGSGTPGPYMPRAPDNLTATSLLESIHFTWTLPPAFLPSNVVELWEYTAATPFSSATKIWEGRTSGVFISKKDTTTRYYWVRSRASNGNVSPTEPDETAGLAGHASGVSSTLNASGGGSVAKTAATATITTATRTVTATGGATPYSYAWTKVSGGSITATAASSATTAFQATGMDPAEQRVAIFRCTVTDNVAATDTLDLTAKIIRSDMAVSAAPAELFEIGTGTNLTTDPATATVDVAGTTPYTYAWAATLYGEGITITSPTAASTTFSASGMAVNETRSGYFACTITDSTSPTPRVKLAQIWVELRRIST